MIASTWRDLKPGTYYVVHVTVAALVAFAVTGDLIVSLTLSLLEPTVQAFVYFSHEKAWQRAARRLPAGLQAN